MVESAQKRQTNIEEDLEDLLKEVAYADPKLMQKQKMATDLDENVNEQTTTAKKRRKKKNKKKNKNIEGDELNFGIVSSDGVSPLNSLGISPQENMGQQLRRQMTPLQDKLGASFYNDSDSSEDEGMPDYKFGGYHPMHVGELLIDRYLII